MNRIKFLREEKGIFQKDLANLLDVSIPAINYYENEKRAIDTKTASILADYFNVSIDYLLGKSNVRNPQEINIDEVDIAFAQGVKGLNETNKMIIKNTLEALLAKQEKDKENFDNK